MATNPQYPNERRTPDTGPRDVHPKLKVPPKSQFPWTLIAIMVAAAILIAIIATLPRATRMTPSPAAAQVPPQPTVNQVQLSNLSLQAAPVGGAYYLVGYLHNNGTTAITGVQVEVSFKGANGQTLNTQSRPVLALVKGSEGDAQPLTKVPIKPNQAQMIRIYFDHPPVGWNHQLPGLRVLTVTATAA